MRGELSSHLWLRTPRCDSTCESQIVMDCIRTYSKLMFVEGSFTQKGLVDIMSSSLDRDIGTLAQAWFIVVAQSLNKRNRSDIMTGHNWHWKRALGLHDISSLPFSKGYAGFNQTREDYVKLCKTICFLISLSNKSKPDSLMMLLVGESDKTLAHCACSCASL